MGDPTHPFRPDAPSPSNALGSPMNRLLQKSDVTARWPAGRAPL